MTGEKFKGFTFIYGSGRWEGRSENSLVIELIEEINTETLDKLRELSQQIKELNKQEAVYLTSEPIQGVLL